MSPAQASPFPLGVRNLSRVEGWGMSARSLSYHFKPRSVEEILDVYKKGLEYNLPIALRGGGRSYGDASINDSGIVLDLTRMNAVLDWNPETGVVECEPGVTLEKLWKTSVPDGWWPPVVSGTMYTSVGGCAAMNIHGKNNFRKGPFGEHILEFDLLTPSGELLTCTPESEPELFHAAISGFGMLGCFTRLKIQLSKVYSGCVMVEAYRTASLEGMLGKMERQAPTADYIVGWVDCLSRGNQFGRGIIHEAWQLKDGADQDPRGSMQVRNQQLPDRILGVVPKSLMWIPLQFFVNKYGMRLINTAKYRSSYLMPDGHRYWQPHAAFHFLLDFVPNWKNSYKPGGLIQYQAFVPKEHAADVFAEMIETAQQRGMPSFLGVTKRHRPDAFLMTHSVDGFSIALDFPVYQKTQRELWRMCHFFDSLVLEAGGRFYFAKDSTLTEPVAEKLFGEQVLDQFFALKFAHDPEGLLQTNLARRLFSNRLQEGQ